ncbi:hypothetical protein [Thalassospira australica]|uniref:hypothetical protein n=1 Tax=Thalassospira australica TaxID=1528106 RepID=UPI003850EFAB
MGDGIDVSGLVHPALMEIEFLVSCSALVIYGTYVALFSTCIAVRTYRRFFRGIDAVFGAVPGAIGGKLLLDGMCELCS